MGVVSRRWVWVESMGVVARRYIDFLILLTLLILYLLLLYNFCVVVLAIRLSNHNCYYTAAWDMCLLDLLIASCCHWSS